MQKEPPQVAKLLRTEFQSLDEYTDSLLPYNARVYQLSPGLFTSSNTLIQFDGCRLMKQFLSQSTLVSLRASGDVGFCFPLQTYDYYWRDRKITFADQFAVLTEDLHNKEATVIQPGAISQILISFNSDALQRALTDGEYARFRLQIKKIYFQGMRYEGKRSLSDELLALFDNTVIRLENSEVVNDRDFVAELARLILSYLKREIAFVAPKAVNAQVILNRVIAGILANPEQIDIDELISKAHTSKRNLNYAFNNITQYPPKRFVNLLKLNRFRQLLKMQKSPRDISLLMADIGYTNFSRINKEYAHHFGETPKHTLKKALAESAQK